MGLLVGILIGVFCRRYRTAFFWCLGISLLLAGFLTLGASTDASTAVGPKIGVVAVGFLMTMLFLSAGAMGAIALKRLAVRRKAATATAAEVFGPAPAAPATPVGAAPGRLSGGA